MKAGPGEHLGDLDLAQARAEGSQTPDEVADEVGESVHRHRQADESIRTLLFDLHATRIINSIGISLLLEVLEGVLAVEGTLAFCSLSPGIAKTFQIMGLAQYARIFTDRETALAELSARS